MKKILYITNKEVPYKVEFFNQLAKTNDLVVIYESENPNARNKEWAKSKPNCFKYYYIDDDKTGKKFPIIKIMNIIKMENPDDIIIGCITNKIEVFVTQILKLKRRKYFINVDGEYFFNEKNLKNKIKAKIMCGADKYFVAGEKSAKEIKKYVKKDGIPYYFSSLTLNELKQREKDAIKINEREDFILVVGQYFDYKGMDIALETATKMPDKKFKFIGMGFRTDLMKKKVEELNAKNVELIPFLQKDELNEEYKKCKLLILPSKKECWGLVINEAASYGTPIISTYGSGAAIEFLEDNYSQFLAKPGDAQSLLEKIKCYENLSSEEKENYE